MTRPRLPGAIILTAALGCYQPTDYDGATTKAVLSVSVADLPADGASLAGVSLAVPPGALNNLSAVLSVSGGSLVGATQGTLTLPLRGGNLVTAQWQAPATVGTGLLIARIGTTLVLRDSVRFVDAAPDTVEVDPVALGVAGTATGEVGLRVHLRRRVGKASAGLRATITADTNGIAFGRVVSSTPSDAEGLVNARFAPGLTAYRGPVTVTASVTAGGVTRVGRNIITVTN